MSCLSYSEGRGARFGGSWGSGPCSAFFFFFFCLPPTPRCLSKVLGILCAEDRAELIATVHDGCCDSAFLLVHL